MGIKKIEQFIFEDANQKRKISQIQAKISQILISPIPMKEIEYDIRLCTELGKYYYILENFERILTENLSHCNPAAFYQNIETLKFKLKNDLSDIILRLTNIGLNGIYNEVENQIKIYEQKVKTKKDIPEFIKLRNEDTINHELLHMSSRKKQKEIICCGFHVNSPKFSFGYGLNEGYTENLNFKYFSDMIAVKSYPKEMILAAGIERIIGKERMEKLYFDADVTGLIAELEKYTTRENVISMLYQIDLLSESNEIKKIKDFLKIKDQISEIIEKKEHNTEFSEFYKNTSENKILDYLYEDILIKKKEKFKQQLFESLIKEEKQPEKKQMKIYLKQKREARTI